MKFQKKFRQRGSFRGKHGGGKFRRRSRTNVRRGYSARRGGIRM